MNLQETEIPASTDQSIQFTDRALSWRLQHRCAGQAHVLLVGLGEVCGATEEGIQIARRCGEAAAQPFGLLKVTTIVELEEQLNQILMKYEWGYVHVGENDDCITIGISEYPVLNDRTGNAEEFVFAFMEGFVGACVSRLSGSDLLGISIEAKPRNMAEPLILRFGRHV